jgi:inward rectifier potassium channel
MQINDLGLGSKAKRLITKEGRFNVRRVGQKSGMINTYQYLITMPWWMFLSLVFSVVFFINCLFAVVYFNIGIEHFTGITANTWYGQLLKCLFFSFQTFTTVGYGYIAPTGFLVNFLAAFEALTGLMVFAIITGLLYGRFAKPTAKIIYSQNMLVAPYENGWSYQFRVVNRRKSIIMDLHARILVSFAEKGKPTRTYYPLDLERDKVVLFPLNWTIVHPLTPKSPLWGKTEQDLRHLDTEIIIVLKGYDDTFSQDVNAIYSYRADEIVFGGKFNVMYETDADGTTVMHVDRLNSYQPVAYHTAAMTKAG